jgi:acyl-CoA thioester hydrolase
MYSAETKIRVRYSETDQMQYVYYGNYPAYYEVGRVEALRQLGMSYKSLEDSGVMMPVLECHSKYFKPALYDSEINIRVTIPTLPTARITFLYELFNEQEELIHTGETILAFVNMTTNRPTRMPIKMHDLLRPFFNEG